MSAKYEQSKGILAVWTDIAPEAEDDFIAWYDREHLPERAGNEGFFNARRYRAEEGAPRTFAAYDTASLANLGSPAYVQALANQTPWSLRMFPHFRNTMRMVGEQVSDHGQGMGGVLLTLRYQLDPGAADELRAFALGEHPATLHGRKGIIRVTVVLGAWSEIGTDAAEAARRAADAPDAGLVIVEATEPGIVDGARRALLEGDGALLPPGLRAPEVGRYALQCGVTRQDVED